MQHTDGRDFAGTKMPSARGIVNFTRFIRSAQALSMRGFFETHLKYNWLTPENWIWPPMVSRYTKIPDGTVCSVSK